MKCRYAIECKRGCTDVCQAANSYCPSNGSEGMCFTSSFCEHCIHDHPDPENKKKCEILTATMLYYPTDPEYPREWIYGADGEPTCTNYVKWDWGNDGDPDDPDNPNKLPDPPDPAQLNLFPLYPNEEEFNVTEENRPGNRSIEVHTARP